MVDLDDPAPTRAWALLVEYHGAGFAGWQRQDRPAGYIGTGAPELATVQSVLEAAAAAIAGRPTPVAAAGRTDAGVHAQGQVARVALPARLDAAQVCNALNFHAKPHLVSVLRAAPAAPDWHPRFAAIGRCYRYRILNRPARAALHHGLAWHVPRPLDAAAMQQGADRLIGHHDFSSFRAASCQAASPLRTLDRLAITRHGELIELVVEARSFLHHQVRNIVGTLKLVGDGRWTADDVAAALAARSRAAAGPTAPPQGLCLTAVRYPLDPFGG